MPFNVMEVYIDYNCYAIGLIIAVIVYIIYKLTFWRRQKQPYFLNYASIPYCKDYCPADQQHIQQLPKIICTYEYLSPVVVIRDAKLINEVLVKKFDNFSERKRCIGRGKVLGDSMLWSDGANEWPKHSSVARKAFCPKNMLEMSKHFWKTNYEFTDLINQILNYEQFLDLKVFLNMFAMKAYVNCCFGGAIDQKIQKQLIDALDKLMKTNEIDTRVGKLSARIKQLLNVKTVDDRALAEINAIVDHLYANRKVDECKNCILFMLSDANKGADGNHCLSKKQIIDNSILFAIMGFKTSMTTVCHLIHHLATNQVIQQKLIKEIDDVFDEKPNNESDNKEAKDENKEENKVKINDKNEEKTENKDMNEEKVKEEENGESDEGNGFLETIESMEYLDACIRETLRLYPPVPIIKRKATKAVKLGDICVPKGCQIFIPVSAVHRDPDYWPKPEAFRPERFTLNDKSSKKMKRSYLAFGGDGPRDCPAMSVALLEIKLCIISLLKNYRFAKCKETKSLQYHSTNEMFSSITPNSVFVKVIRRSRGILE